jgi:lysophospholipase L1-like esterase
MPRDETAFQMAMIGDSVVWGSGLPEEDKPWTLVRLWLEQRLRRPVQTHVVAHSLAVIEPDPKDAEPPEWGEIRFRHPSITYEALTDPRLAALGPSGIDLILMNGGINDMNPFNLILPWRSPQWVSEQAAEVCGRKMKNLLLPMLGRFRNAQVVVTGYYPIVSSSTWFVRALPLPALRQRLVDLSEAWKRASGQWLQWAVGQANLHTSAASTARVFYANPDFQPENCYGAPDTYLWTFREAFRDRSAVGQRRRCECRRLRPWDPICPIDMAFHPNRKGARAYAEAVIKVLDRVAPTFRA